MNTRRTVTRYLDTPDATSTSNLTKHAKKCWGETTVKTAQDAGSIIGIRRALARAEVQEDGSIRACFNKVGSKGTGKVLYSHRQFTREETRCVCFLLPCAKVPTHSNFRAEIVRWVTESARPFDVVKDCGWQSLMKTGRPGYWTPSPKTVARNVRQVFVHSRQRLANILQVSTTKHLEIRHGHSPHGKNYEGDISCATDAWTSPNHKPYMAVTVHFIHNNDPISLLLDIVEVAASHTGKELAGAFACILEEFGVADKVRD